MFAPILPSDVYTVPFPFHNRRLENMPIYQRGSTGPEVKRIQEVSKT